MGSCFLTVNVIRPHTKMVVQDTLESVGKARRPKARESRKRKAVDKISDETEEENNRSKIDLKEDSRTEVGELTRLQKLLPTVSIKDNVTQLDIILEAIRYIDNLQFKLKERGVTT